MQQSERHRQTRFDALALALVQSLRNPLSTVTMTLELLREELSRAPDQGPGVKRVDAVLEEVKRLERVCADFLRFARDPELELAPCDVNVLIEESLSGVGAVLRSRGVTPVLQLDRRIAPVRLDQRLFRQAVACLVDNVAGTLQGGVLTIQTRMQSATVEIDVIDAGPGHGADAWARMFDSYFTSMSGGSGAGLALVRQILELHGGRVEPEGAAGPGVGNRIRITLPAAGAS
jgi:nitrogen fixation/metabolism regulation signal transduction histidine kinase